MEHNGVDQRTAVMAGRRMYDHSLRLVDDKDIVILIQDIKRNILRKDIRNFRVRYPYNDVIVFICFIICFYSLIVDKDTSVF